jgi:hypothetical protein
MYPVAPGHPNYSQGGSSEFIPELWSGKLLEKFYIATVFAAISNIAYEGEIKNYGDNVTIRTTPDISINDYVVGQNLVYQRPESVSTELLIDKGKYFAFTCDDVIAKQSDLKLLDDWMGDAAEQMKIKIDAQLLQTILPDVSPVNKGATAGKITAAFNMGAAGAPVQITKANVLDYIVDCGTLLDETNRPESNRFIVIPAWAAGMLKKSDLKDASMMGDGTSTLRNGRLGGIDRFTIYTSNNLYYVNDGGKICFNCIFGHKSGISFASQMTKTETLRAESTFGDLVRGLNIYGFKVLQPESVGILYCYK